MKYVTLIFFYISFGCNNLLAQSQNVIPPSEATAREQLKQERKYIESTYASKETDCYKKFSVNPCLDKARTEKNIAMAENKRREILLNDQKREEKKQSTLKTSKGNSSNSEKIDAANRKLASKEVIDSSKRVDSAKGRVDTANIKKREAQAKADQRVKKNMLSAASAAKYQEKITAAEAHKTSVEQRNAGNAKPRALPLPLPKSIEN